MPLAAGLAAPCVSSDRCTEASKPVIVYCVRMNPNGMIASQKLIDDVEPPDHPEPLNRSLKTCEKLRCWSGTQISAAIRMTAPATCHHTETLLRIANSWLEKMLISAITTRITTKNRKTLFSDAPEYQPHAWNVRSKKVAQP